MKQAEAHPWHQLDAEAVLQRLAVTLQEGLSADEVKRRQAELGLNQMTTRRGTPAWVKFLQQFNQALMYVLLAATVVSAALGEWVDAAVIFGVVFINAVVGFRARPCLRASRRSRNFGWCAPCKSADTSWP